MPDTDPDVTSLTDALRHCRRELASVREEQETWAERIAALEDAARRLDALSSALDERLRARDRASAGVRGWVKRRVVKGSPAPMEIDDVMRLRSSPLFDGAWYLREYPDVAATGLSPALHYLRHGVKERKNPGPHFDTRSYLEEHPDLPKGANPLLHYQAGVPGVAP
jgi:nucleotide-binding universal stress UspA family protein